MFILTFIDFLFKRPCIPKVYLITVPYSFTVLLNFTNLFRLFTFFSILIYLVGVMELSSNSYTSQHKIN